ncbi:MAG: alanyl-tRNA editing protein [Deltaproteobacteria bacterium]
MPKTERLYYTDCYLREFEARILAIEPGASGFRAFLDKTAFYPESGGQPSDRGLLGGAKVLDVVDEGDGVVHLLDAKPGSDSVQGAIDWTRRFDHMQQHTGQHVLSAAFERSGQYKTVSFHLGAESSSIDLDSDRLGERQLEEAEALANQIVFDDREVRILFRSAEEANQMELRKPTERQGDIRLIQIDDFDLSACGGTHVSRTGAIGMIAVRKFERMKGLTRVEFLCGGRALRAVRSDFKVLAESARLFSGAASNLPALIEKQAEELKQATRTRIKQSELLAEYKARELLRDAPEGNARKLVRLVVETGDLIDAKALAHAIAKQPDAIALIGEKGTPAKLYFSQTAGGPSNLGDLLKQTVAKFGGKGGGARDFAQGGGLGDETLEKALDFAASLIS